jgi:hypothetical protein
MFNADGTKKPYLTGVPAAPTTGLGKVILDPKADPQRRTTAITIADAVQSSGVDTQIIAQIVGGMSDADMAALSDGDVRGGFVSGLKFGGKIDKVNNTFAPKAASTDVNDVADYVEQVLGLTDLNAVLLAASETVAAGVPGDALNQANTFMSLMGGVFAPGMSVGTVMGTFDRMSDVVGVGRVTPDNVKMNAFAKLQQTLQELEKAGGFAYTATGIGAAKAKAVEDAEAARVEKIRFDAEQADTLKRMQDEAAAYKATEHARAVEAQNAETRRQEAQTRQKAADNITLGIYSAGKRFIKKNFK